MDEKTGEYNQKYNMQNLLEDFYLPVRGNDQATQIETTPGLQYDGIQDVEYLREKLFAALKVPKAFMGYEKDLTGKATLAAEDIRFGRTIDRIQRILISELYKIALVHLYAQGYRDEQMTNFELDLTTPSIIYDQEKIALMKEKVDLAGQMMENKLFPTDWIYEHVFHFSEGEYEEYRDLIVQDQKRQFRLAQIETEGNDPLTTGRSYGTPHDLASLYGTGRMDSDPANVPDGYDEKLPLGRPEEKVSNINTQDNVFGKDRLGKKEMKTDEPVSLREGAEKVFLKNRTLLESMQKELVYTSDKKKESLLDESNIKE
tara:strand:- start:725 stop:1672 length:948 start_codon:yes stop_codon:yes gene_type:complete